MPFPSGKVLGGSSAINGMLYIRGQAEDYDAWRDAGNAGWGWEDVLPYFRKAEDQQHGVSESHGAGGPIGVSDTRPSSPASPALSRCRGAERYSPPRTTSTAATSTGSPSSRARSGTAGA